MLRIYGMSIGEDTAQEKMVTKGQGNERIKLSYIRNGKLKETWSTKLELVDKLKK